MVLKKEKLNISLLSLLASLCFIILLLSSCSHEGAVKSSSVGNSYIKLYDWKDVTPKNLASLLKNDRAIFEFKASKDQREATVTLDLLKDGEIQTLASMSFPVDNKDANYLSIATDFTEEEDNLINVSLNGNHEILKDFSYFSKSDVQKVSILGNERKLESSTYLMYVNNSGEALDLDAIYDKKVVPKDVRSIVFKLELH